MANVKNIKPSTKKRVESFIYNFEKKNFRENEKRSAKKQRDKMEPFRYIRYVNGVQFITIHKPVKH